MKTGIYAAGAILLLLAGLCYQHQRLTGYRAENQILSTNIEVLTGDIDTYRVRDSLNAASIGALELKASEYDRYRAEDARLIADLRIQLKRAESIAKNATESTYEITTVVRDTAIVSGEVLDTARTFSYRTPYIDLKGLLRRNLVELDFTTRDTLLQVVHRVPRKFLFIRYGTKAIRQEVVSTNPHTEITYTEYIRLRK
jgi:hypothetical protein